MKFPKDVLSVMDELKRAGPSRSLDLMKRLTAYPEHEAMWRSLAKRATPRDDTWVWAFLEAVEHASDLPGYQYRPNRDRKELGERIRALSTELKMLYRAADLSPHVVRLEGERIRKEVFDGLYVLEALPWDVRARIEERKIQRISVLEVLERAAAAAHEELCHATGKVRAGKNVRAIRFLRALAKRNRAKYGTPLLAVIATVTNTLYDTDYVQTDIRRLVTTDRLGEDA